MQPGWEWTHFASSGTRRAPSSARSSARSCWPDLGTGGGCWPASLKGQREDPQDAPPGFSQPLSQWGTQTHPGHEGMGGAPHPAPRPSSCASLWGPWGLPRAEGSPAGKRMELLPGISNLQLGKQKGCPGASQEFLGRARQAAAAPQPGSACVPATSGPAAPQKPGLPGPFSCPLISAELRRLKGAGGSPPHPGAVQPPLHTYHQAHR